MCVGGERALCLFIWLISTYNTVKHSLCGFTKERCSQRVVNVDWFCPSECAWTFADLELLFVLYRSSSLYKKQLHV